ncbi:proton-conducting transporter transmembrane domain-containing protein [Bythopirellula goksoeyrii]|uniref:NADH-quinone oxidoreductase subunit L n=1 Tax=Bythopirellula goksoeyrii TaxID=1400387 RepID=A0A5B9QD70_9BACT|nr:proton-conducting transporter membrane subunit [Bythopirellula goksoeyrii]QEG36898.1 NADH-quinone oxidoreductase subunit L [Bythopirellula goksoeyrii]
MSTNNMFFVLGIAVLVCPAALVAILGIPPLVGRPLSEKTINRYAYAATVIGLLVSLLMLVMMLTVGTRHVPIELGNWVVIPQQHFHFHLKFVFDRLSIPFVILSFLLCGTVSAFTSHYLHRESGYGRFYVCYSFFLLGMIISSLAGTIEVLFLGWELVGLSSALLVAYFHERPTPVINGLRVWSVYRIADAAFLMAAVAMHHLTGAGDFDRLVGTGSWPDGIAVLTSDQALTVGLLLLIAAAGKSALVPFSGWLPRAMEGPTPSSAIFYGALSVHLGAYLLLRVSPLLEVSVPLAVAVITIGIVTSLMATLLARVQTDIKSALAYASLIQVGIIVAEIGLGLRYIALIHMLGHACMRTLQLLRAPTLLHDYHTIENALGGRSAGDKSVWGRWLPLSLQYWVYRFASHRGYLDGILDEFVVHPFQRLFKWCDAAERRWTDFLSRGRSRASDDVQVHSEIVEELRL